MRSIRIREPGGPEVLEVAEREAPEPGYGQVRVSVRFAGVNRADLLQRAGVYPAPPGVPADVPGLEYAGVIDKLGPGATRWSVGDRVYGLVAGGAYAEQLVAHELEVAPTPKELSDEQAAACPEVYVTAWDAMVTQAGLGAGDRVLVHAAGSGVGTAAIQIAKSLGCFVVGTSRTQDKLDRCRALGLDAGVVPDKGEFASAVLAATGGRGVDVVLDLVGGAYVGEALGCVAPRGRIVVVGMTGGARTELPLGLLLQRRATILGTVLRARPLDEKIATAKLLAHRLSPLFASGRLAPVIDRVFPLAEAGQAHALVATDKTFGKVLLKV